MGASAALAYGQKVGAESAVDINLAKQLNTVMTQMGVNPASIVMQAGSAAAGYGFEYLASTLERIKLAALGQGDAQLQMPIMTPVSPETWGDGDCNGFSVSGQWLRCDHYASSGRHQSDRPDD